MIMRILVPDAGHIRVLGEETWKTASDRVAYLPEERGLYKKMTVANVLRFYAELKGFRDCRPAIAGWLERMGLGDWADKPVEALSKGMSQKVQFIATVVAALLHLSQATRLDAAHRRGSVEAGEGEAGKGDRGATVVDENGTPVRAWRTGESCSGTSAGTERVRPVSASVETAWAG
jgi:hypothetical protein